MFRLESPEDNGSSIRQLIRSLIAWNLKAATEQDDANHSIPASLGPSDSVENLQTDLIAIDNSMCLTSWHWSLLNPKMNVKASSYNVLIAPLSFQVA